MMRQTASALVVRDLRLLWKRRGDALQPALFALLTVVLFALGLGGDAKSLAPVASAVLWLAVLRMARSNNGCWRRCRCGGWCWCAP